MKGIVELNRKLKEIGKKYCPTCKRNQPLELFPTNSGSCRDCKNKRIRELKEADPLKYREKRRQYNISYAKNQGLLYYARRNITSWKQASIKKNIPFDLTIEYVMDLWQKQSGKCYYTGADLKFTLPNTNIGFPKKDAPSLDRLIPNKGYVRGNVVWCVWWANRMKYEMEEEEFYNRIQNIMRHKDEQDKKS